MFISISEAGDLKISIPKKYSKIYNTLN